MSGQQKTEKKEQALARIHDHIKQWGHNRDFIQAVPTKFSDWIVTGSLYVAVHAVEALLTADDSRPRSTHRDRLQILESEPRYEHICKAFHTLYNLAHVTRYSASPSRWLKAEDIEEKVVTRLIYPIEKSVKKLISAAKYQTTIQDMPAIHLKRETTK